MKKDFISWEEWDKEANKYADGKEGLVIITHSGDEDLLKKQFKIPIVVFLNKGDKGLKPINYSLPNGVTIKGHSKKTRKGKIKGAIVAETADGILIKEAKERQYASYGDFKKKVKEFCKQY